ncbi:MAG TPA: PhoU domain-containing protein [Terriglobales bacterium]|nr:PhoU domain-containing protein [Terriglobales bacterium]
MTASRRKPVQGLDSTREMTNLIQQSCLVAKDAAFNLRDFLEKSSNMAFIAVKDCEKELDRAERRIDEQITGAITQVSEAEARELLACLKFIIDLERIGDLTWSVTQRLQRMTGRLLKEDRQDLITMAEILEKMLENIQEGFVKRDLDSANWVLKTDTQIDHVCHAVFRRHLENKETNFDYSTNLLLMAQAFERAGDHAKNLGEELFHLVEGHTMRHEPKRPKTSRQMQ